MSLLTLYQLNLASGGGSTAEGVLSATGVAASSLASRARVAGVASTSGAGVLTGASRAKVKSPVSFSGVGSLTAVSAYLVNGLPPTSVSGFVTVFRRRRR